MFFSQACDLVVVDLSGLFVQTVWHDVVEEAREIDRRAVRQVTTVREAHAEYCIARFEQCHVNSSVRL